MSGSPGNQTCPEGFGPDLLYRFAMEPFFTEPYGQDCFFSYLGYNIFGGIVLAYAGACLVLSLVTLPDQTHWLLQSVAAANIVNMITVSSVIILGWADPRSSHIAFAVFIILFHLTGFLWAFVGYQTLMKTIVRVEVKKDVTAVSLLGGPLMAFGLLGVLIVTFLVTSAGAIGISVTVPRSEPTSTVMFYRMLTGSISVGVSAFLIAGTIVMSKFVILLDTVVNAESSTGGIPTSGASTMEIIDIANRYRLARKLFISCLPLVSFLVLQCILIPTFWYLFLLHLMNGINACFAVWVGITSKSKRIKIYRRLLPCWQFEDLRPTLPTSSANRIQSERAVAVVLSQQIASHANPDQ